MIGINKQKKYNSHKTLGFAMLYTLILITIISTLSFGAASLSFKQKQLSRLTLDSQNALYMADSGLECALMYYYEGFNMNSYVLPVTIDCLSPFLDVNNQPENIMLDSSSTNIYGFPSTYPIQNSCFEIEVEVDTSVTPNITTAIRSKGYNICDPNDSRRVERVLQVIFE